MKTTIKPQQFVAATGAVPMPRLVKALKAGAAAAVVIDGRLYRVTTDYQEVIVDLVEKGKATVEVEPWDGAEVSPAPVVAPAAAMEPTASPAPASPPRRGPGRPWHASDARVAKRTALSLTQFEAGRQLAEARGVSLSALIDELLYQAAGGKG